MSDYAGAVAAVEQRLRDGWTVTPIVTQNALPPEPWPPTEADPQAPSFPEHAAWVALEVLGAQSKMYGAGTPGSQTWLYDSLIQVHVFVPSNTGTANAFAYAVAIGELFRGKVFYDAGDGCYVRTWAPHCDGGGTSDDDGNWFRVTMSVPMEYWHRG